MQGVGCRVWGSGFRVQGSGFRVYLLAPRGVRPASDLAREVGEVVRPDISLQEGVEVRNLFVSHVMRHSSGVNTHVVYIYLKNATVRR